MVFHKYKYLEFNLLLVFSRFRCENIHNHAFYQRQEHEAEGNQQVPVQCLWVADFWQVTIKRTKKEHDG